MSAVCPCVTATDARSYREQLARVVPFATRVHLDSSDGVFSPVKLVNPVQIYWPEGIVADVHLMHVRPEQHLETLVSLTPNLVIIHAEAQGDLLGMMRQLHAVGIKTGVALLQQTAPESAHDLIADADHVLIFSGDLGHFGGVADLTLLQKVRHIQAINANIEIGWDGGVSADNIAQLALGGVEAINAGGYIQKAPDPQEAYATLVKNIPKQMV